VSFALPCLGAFLFCLLVPHWTLHAAEIGGIALSTTSVAVVYAVMVETGLNRTDLGKLILAACFVTDFGTVLALGVLFVSFNGWLVLFVAVTCVTLSVLPRLTRFVISSVGNRVSEPEVKFIFLILFVLGWLAQTAKSEAVLPAYLVGLVIAGVFVRDRVLVDRMRSIAFALLTPFYFLKAGLYVSVPAVVTGIGLIVVLLLVKLVTKGIGVWPVARGVVRLPARESTYTTLLMSTGLTFGTISALFGLTNHLITQAQYTILVTVVILSAVVPTLIAQGFFRPTATAPDGHGARRGGRRRGARGDGRGGAGAAGGGGAALGAHAERRRRRGTSDVRTHADHRRRPARRLYKRGRSDLHARAGDGYLLP